MTPPVPLPVISVMLFAAGAALTLIAARWGRPHGRGKLHPHVATVGWILGNVVLTTGAITSVRVALGLALHDLSLEPLRDVLLGTEVIAFSGVGLLLLYAEAETSRRWLACVAVLAAGLSGGCAFLLQPLGLEPNPIAAALSGALFAPLLLSSGTRANLVTRVRKEAMSASGDRMMVVDSEGRLLQAPQETLEALELGSGSKQREGLPDALRGLIRDEEPRRVRLRTQSGRILEAWATRTLGRSPLKRARGLLIRDITGRYSNERRLVRLAHHDSLTGLANRRLFLERLKGVIKEAGRSNTQAALFYLDLDDFKAINDALGHSAGDALLQTLADRLRTMLSPDEVVRFGVMEGKLSASRLSGDEFAVIAPSLPDSETASKLANWILEVVRRPVQLSDGSISPSASVGIALWPDDGRDLDTLIGHADAALYAAKSKGRDRYARYDARLDEKVDRARTIEEGLRKALDHSELRLFYQPKVDARTESVVGFEALTRWRSSELGDVGPAEFIPIAEERGLISDLGTWTLDEACRQLREWEDAGLAIVPVAVNVSSHQFKEVDLQRIVTDSLNRYDIDPQYLELELTESLLLEEADNVEMVVRDLRSIGIRIALDDFGTGYSALTYLNRFNLDVLKMDRGLLRDIHTNPSAMGIASAVVSMAHSLELAVVAEGIDMEEQVGLLREMHCDYIQGFLYAPALPAPDVVPFMARIGDSLPVCIPRGGVPDAQCQEDPSAIEDSDDPVIEGKLSTAFDEAPDQTLLEERGRLLVIDDGNGTLGLTALRLSRIGFDVHYVAEVDEAYLLIDQEFENIRAIAAPPTVEMDGLRKVAAHLTKRCGERQRVVITGERPDDPTQAAIREAGVDWVLWAPVSDTELRSHIQNAMAQAGAVAGRSEPRVPVDLIASVSCGTRHEVAVVSSLSPRGAFIEMNAPFPVGSSLRIDMKIIDTRFRGFGRVLYVQHEDPERLYEPSGIGVVFFGSDRDTEQLLRKGVKGLEARYLP